MRPHAIKWKYDQFADEAIRHVDLDHILSITEPELYDNTGHGAWYVRFYINFMFLDKPVAIVARCETVWDNVKRQHNGPVMVDGVAEGLVRLRLVFEELYRAWCGQEPPVSAT